MQRLPTMQPTASAAKAARRRKAAAAGSGSDDGGGGSDDGSDSDSESLSPEKTHLCDLEGDVARSHATADDGDALRAEEEAGRKLPEQSLQCRPLAARRVHGWR